MRGLVAGLGVAFAFAFSPAVAQADHPLQPDLVTVDLSGDEIYLQTKGKRTLLRLGNRVGNSGEGPLEFRPGSTSTNCDGDGNPTNDLPGFQRIYEDEWPGDEYQDIPTGCVQYHPPHNHWHVTEIARYSLVEEATGELVDGNKVGFCLLDSGTLDGPFEQGFYDASGCGFGGTSPSIIGISPGFYDYYGPPTPGQHVNVTGLERGRYCLRSTANPENVVVESNAGNNAAEVRVRLNPAKLRVAVLPGPCLSG